MLDPLLEVMLAQKDNLSRIQTDLILAGTTQAGEQLTLNGPAPDLIRLLDTPLRMQQQAVRAESSYERILTIAPVRMANAGKIVHRRDETLIYVIHGAVTLNDKERADDEASKYATNPLSLKLFNLKADVELVLFDDYSLDQRVQEITGLETSFAVEYPVAAFSMTVTCLVSGCYGQ